MTGDVGALEGCGPRRGIQHRCSWAPSGHCKGDRPWGVGIAVALRGDGATPPEADSRWIWWRREAGLSGTVWPWIVWPLLRLALALPPQPPAWAHAGEKGEAGARYPRHAWERARHGPWAGWLGTCRGSSPRLSGRPEQQPSGRSVFSFSPWSSGPHLPSPAPPLPHP